MKKYISLKEYSTYGDAMIFELKNVKSRGSIDYVFDSEFNYKILDVELGKLIGALRSRPIERQSIDTDDYTDFDIKKENYKHSLGDIIKNQYKINSDGTYSEFKSVCIPEGWLKPFEFENDNDASLAIMLNPKLFYGEEEYRDSVIGGYLFINEQEF